MLAIENYLQGEIFMKKKLAGILAVAIAALAFLLPVQAQAAGEDIRIFINGSELVTSQKVTVIDGRTMVPMRAIFEALDCTVFWYGDRQAVAACDDRTMVAMVVNDPWIFVGDKDTMIDLMNRTDSPEYANYFLSHVSATSVPARLLNDRVYVPLRVVGESLGCQVDWNAAARAIYITG